MTNLESYPAVCPPPPPPSGRAPVVVPGAVRGVDEMARSAGKLVVSRLRSRPLLFTVVLALSETNALPVCLRVRIRPKYTLTDTLRT